MKLSTKIILPIIVISALLILLAGCFGIPADESPGFTPGTITGIIVAPCGNTTGEPFSETSDSPEFWGYYCEEDWYLQADVEVVLTYGEDEVATTTTDEFGVYTFTDVPPGKNYVITAYYPDNNITLVKDVALELIEGGSFDAKNTDIVSTSLGLVVDFLIVDIGLTPDDISLDEVIADRPDFPNFPKFKILVIEVGKVLEDCGNVNTDGNVQAALYDAAEEISGDAPGFTEDTGDTGGGGAFIGGAAPAAVSHTLTVTIVGNGIVEVDTIAYTGPVTVDEGTSLALLAIPDSGYQFDGWSGDASASPVIMDADKSVTATFSEISTSQYTLTVTIVGNGIVEVDTIAYTGPVTVDKDTSLALVAIPDSGYQFVDWTGDVVDPNSVSTTVTMNADKTVTANFDFEGVEPDTYIVDASVSGGNGGVLPPTQSVNHGASASIAIDLDTGYHLASITDNTISMDITGITDTYTIASVTEYHNVVFAFSPVIGPLFKSGEIIISWSLDDNNEGRLTFVGFELDGEFSGSAGYNKDDLTAGKQRLIITLDQPYYFGEEPALLSLTPYTISVSKQTDFTVDLEIADNKVGIITLQAKNQTGTFFIKIEGTETNLRDLDDVPITFTVDLNDVQVEVTEPIVP